MPVLMWCPLTESLIHITMKMSGYAKQEPLDYEGLWGSAISIYSSYDLSDLKISIN